MAITGGAGFIGSNAAAYFASRGWHVTCADNFSRAGAEANAQWLREQQITVVRLDLRNAEDARAFCASNPFDAVLHCAAQVAVTTSVTDPRRDFEDNLLGTFNLLEGIRQSGRRPRLIYTSTNKVYGGMEDLVVELRGGRYQYRDAPFGIGEERPLDFHSPYGCSKGGADQYVRDYARIYGLPTLVFRQSCIYGERQFGVEDQGWVAWFTIAAVLGKPLTLYGDGMQVRDVLYIKDLVRAFELGFESSLSGEIFNVGGGPQNQLSLLELVSELERLTGKRLSPAQADWRPGDQRVFVCDVRKMERLLGWRPEVDVPAGIAALYAWVTANRGLFKLAA
jgi:CDP-paratose 2-epimerase